MMLSQETCQTEKNTRVPTGDRRVFSQVERHMENHRILDALLE